MSYRRHDTSISRPIIKGNARLRPGPAATPECNAWNTYWLNLKREPICRIIRGVPSSLWICCFVSYSHDECQARSRASSGLRSEFVWTGRTCENIFRLVRPYVIYLRVTLLGLRTRQTLPTLDILGWEYLAQDMSDWAYLELEQAGPRMFRSRANTPRGKRWGNSACP